MKNSLNLGSVSGIRISIHWTFLILIGWIIFSNLSRGLGTTEIIWSIAFILTIFACVVLHELGHALAAKRFNIKTRSITLLPIGGVAQMEAMPEKPKEELIVALAGPAVNVLIYFILYLFVGQSDRDETMAGLQSVGPGNFLYTLMFVNIWLALFNLIPAFPMDGGRVFRALLSFRMERTRATRIAAYLGQFLAMGFIFFGLFYNPFLVFIGLFIFLGAQAESEQTVTQSLMKGYTVQHALLKELPSIEADETIRTAANRLLESQTRYFIVSQNGDPAGIVGRDEIVNALGKLGENAPVSEAMNQEILYLSPDMPIETAMQKMAEQEKAFALVKSNGHVVGALDMDNITEFVMIRAAEQVKH